MNLWPVEHFFPHFLTGLQCTRSKPVKKWGKKCSTGQRFICTEVTSYKIHILVCHTFPDTTPLLLFSWHQEIKEEPSESVSGVKLEESFFDDQLEDGGDIFIIRDEYDRQTILRPRRKFSWWMKQKCRSFPIYFVKLL